MDLMNDYVMIRRIKDTQLGRFFVPDTVETKPRIGIVEQVGPGVLLKNGTRRPVDVQVGDRVSFSLSSGFMTNIPGEKEPRLLIREAGILAVLPPDAEASAVASPWPSYVADGVQGGGTA